MYFTDVVSDCKNIAYIFYLRCVSDCLNILHIYLRCVSDCYAYIFCRTNWKLALSEKDIVTRKIQVYSNYTLPPYTLHINNENKLPHLNADNILAKKN